jgi:hypothetical protein
LVKEESKKENTFKQGSSQLQRIIPSNKDVEPKRRVHSSNTNQPAPKLVIGKITVEILPPKLPAPQKIITRVVQTPAKDNFSKSNKLSFGLGQL